MKLPSGFAFRVRRSPEYGLIFDASVCIKSTIRFLRRPLIHRVKSVCPALPRSAAAVDPNASPTWSRCLIVTTGFRQYFLARGNATIGAFLYRYRSCSYSGIYAT